MAIFGLSGVALTVYFLSADLSGPFHDNLVPELIGFCIEGSFLVGLLSLIQYGTSHFGSEHIGNSIAFTSFALCLIVAAVECRSQTESVLTVDTFDSKQMNWAMIGEFILAVLVTQMDVFNRLLGTTQINLRQFGWSLIPALALLVLWELGKYVARRQGADHLDAGDKTG